MQLGRDRPGTSAAWADAVFASLLQRSEAPTAAQVRAAAAAALRAYGGRGCAERVAQEFGDHPEAAVARMRWARGVAREVFAAPGPAQMAAGEDLKRLRASAPRIRRERRWPEDLPADPRDPDVVRAKALARARSARPRPPQVAWADESSQ